MRSDSFDLVLSFDASSIFNVEMIACHEVFISSQVSLSRLGVVVKGFA